MTPTPSLPGLPADAAPTAAQGLSIVVPVYNEAAGLERLHERLCALAAKVPKASVEKSIKSLVVSAREPWKTELCQKLLDGKIPFNYRLTSKDQLVNKTWDGVSATVYTDGTMVINGRLIEFDPN